MADLAALHSGHLRTNRLDEHQARRKNSEGIESSATHDSRHSQGSIV